MGTEQQLYLRFGAWPDDERSYCPGSSALVSVLLGDCGWVDGVCAFPTVLDASSGEYRYDAEQVEAHMLKYGPAQAGPYFAYITHMRPVYIVTGQPNGCGPVGETLLHQVKTVGHAVVIASDGDYDSAPRIVPITRAVWRTLEAIRGSNTCCWICLA